MATAPDGPQVFIININSFGGMFLESTMLKDVRFRMQCDVGGPTLLGIGYQLLEQSQHQFLGRWRGDEVTQNGIFDRGHRTVPARLDKLIFQSLEFCGDSVMFLADARDPVQIQQVLQQAHQRQRDQIPAADRGAGADIVDGAGPCCRSR